MALVAGFVGFVLLDPPLGIAALAAGVMVEVVELVFWNRFLRRYRIQTGAEGLVGKRGEVLAACAPGHEGRARVHGELWRVRCAAGSAVVGAEVVVTAVDGLTLEVEPTGAQLR